MATAARPQYAIEIEDVEYLRHGNKPLIATVHKPRGSSPCPLIVDIHGGAWCHGDRHGNKVVHEALAKSGIAVAALDFRMPPDAGYPASVIDINYAVRWFKVHASDFGGRSDMMGIMGNSSGGHQAMLSAMRPQDARYAQLLMPEHPSINASVRCAVLCWPVIDPPGRYEYAKKVKQSGNAKGDGWITGHELFWKTELAMVEGSPTRALERGERTELPPVLYVQGTKDFAHPRAGLDRFVAAYRAAGGRLDLQLYENEGEGFITRNHGSTAAVRALDAIIEFVHCETAA